MNRGRPKQFDEQQALEAAMQVFWEKGCEATSCEDLLQAMEINAGSMYATFGDKQTLYERAFSHYCSRASEQFLEKLNGPGTPLENIRSFVQRLSDIDQKGCMIANTLIEFGHEKSGVGKHARRVVGQVRKALEEKLAAAQAAGELAPGTCPSSLAAFIVNTMQGLSVSIRSGAGRDTIRDVVSTALRLLN